MAFPPWGLSSARGVPLGWMASASAPVGAVLAELGEDERVVEAVPLSWQVGHQYLVLRVREAPQLWVRAVPCSYPVSYGVDALLLTQETAPERGIRRWRLLSAEGRSVLLTDTSLGGRPRPWLLREDASYDLEYDCRGRLAHPGPPHPREHRAAPAGLTRRQR